MNGSPLPSPTRSSLVGRVDRRMFVVISGMVILWLALVLGRNVLRAHWWTHKLATAATTEERWLYLQRLTALGPTGAVAVERLLRSEDATLRGLGVAVVNHTKPKAAGRLLTALLTDPDPNVAEMAITGLAMLADPAVVEDLARLLDSGDPDRAVLAVTALARLRTPAAVDLLIETARSHHMVAVRVQAIEELGLLGGPRAVEVLSECLKEETPFTGETVSERSAAALLARAAPQALLEPPPTSRPVSYFATRALQAVTGRNASTDGEQLEPSVTTNGK